MDNVTIRRATLDDLDVLLRFEQGIIETERPLDVTIRTGDDVHYYDLASLIASQDAEVLVAEVDSQIVGSGYAHIRNSDDYLRHRQHSYLGFMYVVPEYRRRGINRLLLEALEGWSVSKGVTEIRLEVYAENAPAIRAYERFGYNSLILEMRKGLTEG
jgi:ribosomal protein S18 acetylase RimI-like enzyme